LNELLEQMDSNQMKYGCNYNRGEELLVRFPFFKGGY